MVVEWQSGLKEEQKAEDEGLRAGRVWAAVAEVVAGALGARIAAAAAMPEARVAETAAACGSAAWTCTFCAGLAALIWAWRSSDHSVCESNQYLRRLPLI